MRRLRPAVRLLLPALAEVICLLLAWQAAAAVADLYPAAVSLRYRAPLTAAELAQAEQPEETEEGAQLRLAAAWYEEEGEAALTNAVRTATAIRYRGDRAAIARLTYLSGGEPGAQEDAALVSEGFARALWGSADVLGQTFSWQGERFTVCGVYEGEDGLYLPQKGREGFCCLELTGPAEDPVGAALDFTARTGLDGWDGAAWGTAGGTLLRLLVWLPPLAGALWALWRLARLSWPRRGAARYALAAAAVLLLGALLPMGAAHLPGWLTPPRWSDFSFWYQLWCSAGARLEEWFRLPVWEKDVEAKRTLLVWLGGWLGSAAALAALKGRLLCAAPPGDRADTAKRAPGALDF